MRGIQDCGDSGRIPVSYTHLDVYKRQIIDALKEKAGQGIFGYTSRPDSYFESIRGWQRRRNGWEIRPELMSWSLGVVPALSSLVKLFSEPGDSILIQTPVYSEFYDVTEAWGCLLYTSRCV